jgi:hypothetical protein
VLWQALQFGLLTLAAYRLWRLAGRDVITQPMRTRIEPHEHLHEMIVCPWCLGSWVTFAVVAVASAVSSVWLPAGQALAAATLVGLIGSRVEE